MIFLWFFSNLLPLADTKPTKPAIKSSTLPRTSSQGNNDTFEIGFYKLGNNSTFHFTIYVYISYKFDNFHESISFPGFYTFSYHIYSFNR